MTSLITNHATPDTTLRAGFALRIPSRIRIARAIAFGAMTVPLIMLFRATGESPFDQIASAFQLGTIVALFRAGIGPRTDRVALLEALALVMMVVLDLRLLAVGPAPTMSLNVELYSPLLVAATVTATVALGLLIGHRITVGEPLRDRVDGPALRQ